MKTNSILLLMAMIAISITACQPAADTAPEVDMDALRATFQEMEDRYAKHQNASQPDSLRFYYADNVVSYAPEEAVVSGIDAVIASIKEDNADDSTNTTVRFEVIDVYAMGDNAVELGSVNVTSDGSEREVGHYMCVFAKQDDGSWKVIREMYNDRFDDDDDDDDDDNDDGE